MELNEKYLKGLIDGCVSAMLLAELTTEDQLNNLNIEWTFNRYNDDVKVKYEYTKAFEAVNQSCSTDRGEQEWDESRPIRDNNWFIISSFDKEHKFVKEVFDVLEWMNNIEFDN